MKRVGARWVWQCDSMRTPADSRDLIEESLFESPPTKMRVFPEESRRCDKPYSGSFGSFRRSPHEAAGGRKSFSGLVFGDAILSVKCPAASCEPKVRRIVRRFLRRLQKRTPLGSHGTVEMEPKPSTRLKVKVVPGSSRNELVGWLGDALKMKVAAHHACLLSHGGCKSVSSHRQDQRRRESHPGRPPSPGRWLAA
jgi:hypothetical protein